MSAVRAYRRQAGPRDRLFFGRPDLWPHHPFLPVIRCPVDEPVECGLLFDGIGVLGLYGFSSSVFLCNLFALPPSPGQFLASPHLSYDTFDELAEDGWVVD